MNLENNRTVDIKKDPIGQLENSDRVRGEAKQSKEKVNVSNDIVTENTELVKPDYDKAAYIARKKQERLNNMNDVNRNWALVMQAEKENRTPVPWIYEKVDNYGNVKEIIAPSILAESIRLMNDFHYIFVRGSAKQGIQRYFYLNGYYKHVTDEEMKGFIKKFIPVSLQRVRDINECLSLLYTDNKFYNMDELNADENIINFENGTLELDTMTLREHSPADLCTIQLKCNYIDNVPKPKARIWNDYNFVELWKNGTLYKLYQNNFDYFLDFLTGGNEAIQEYLLQYMGVALSNIKGYRMKKALFMVGASDAGKSQLKKLTERIIGDGNYSSIDLKELEARFGTSRVYDKRLAGSSDMSFVTVDELKIFKLLTGGDCINVEYKCENGFDATFNGLLWFCCNKLPKFGGDKGDPVFKRMTVVECNNVATVLDPQLQDKMYAERDYIVSLAIKAAKRVIDNGYVFDIPKESKTAVQEFKTEINSFLQFMVDCTEERGINIPYDGISRKRMYIIYCNWCKSNGYKYPQNKKEILEILKAQGLDAVSAFQGHRYYKSFTVTTETIDEYSNYNDDIPPEFRD